LRGTGLGDELFDFVIRDDCAFRHAHEDLLRILTGAWMWR
jgi:hypothetical protein